MEHYIWMPLQGKQGYTMVYHRCLSHRDSVEYWFKQWWINCCWILSTTKDKNYCGRVGDTTVLKVELMSKRLIINSFTYQTNVWKNYTHQFLYFRKWFLTVVFYSHKKSVYYYNALRYKNCCRSCIKTRGVRGAGGAIFS